MSQEGFSEKVKSAGDYQELLTIHPMLAGMNTTGNCYGNAPVERFPGALKMECTLHRRYRTLEEARTDTFFYIEGFYNRRRRHSALAAALHDYFQLYNYERPHQSLGYRTPAHVYFAVKVPMLLSA